jgi:hypothetical protein
LQSTKGLNSTHIPLVRDVHVSFTKLTLHKSKKLFSVCQEGTNFCTENFRELQFLAEDGAEMRITID